MNSKSKLARTSGFFYLLVVISGFFSLMYVPSEIMEWKDATLTMKNIEASKSLFQLGILSDMICYLSFTLLVLFLYKLLQEVNKDLAILMVVLVLVSVPISFYNIINKIEVLELINGNIGYIIADAQEIPNRIMYHLRLNSNVNLIAQIFWGLWLLPFGYLVIKSGFLPKVLGYLLIIGCFGYLCDSVGYLVFENYGDTWLQSIISIPSGLGEIGICLWLLIIGVREKKIAAES